MSSYNTRTIDIHDGIPFEEVGKDSLIKYFALPMKPWSASDTIGYGFVVEAGERLVSIA